MSYSWARDHNIYRGRWFNESYRSFVVLSASGDDPVDTGFLPSRTSAHKLLSGASDKNSDGSRTVISQTTSRALYALLQKTAPFLCHMSRPISRFSLLIQSIKVWVWILWSETFCTAWFCHTMWYSKVPIIFSFLQVDVLVKARLHAY